MEHSERGSHTKLLNDDTILEHRENKSPNLRWEIKQWHHFRTQRKKTLNLRWEIKRKSHYRELIKIKFKLINRTPQIIERVNIFRTLFFKRPIR